MNHDKNLYEPSSMVGCLIRVFFNVAHMGKVILFTCLQDLMESSNDYTP